MSIRYTNHALFSLSSSLLGTVEHLGACLTRRSGRAWPCGLEPTGGQSRLLTVGLARPQEHDQNNRVDSLHSIQDELKAVSERIRVAVTSEIPALQQAATYFFLSGSEGKRIRPSICLLLSSALASESPPEEQVLTADLRSVAVTPTEVRRRQQRIAEISELIHVASLLHDDVIDDADARRGKPALNHVMGNKVAILAGDFLLARASMTLASLQNTAVVTLMSQILEDLVSGEVLQATAARARLASMDLYTEKTYLKTASLLANACKATAVLSHASTESCEASFQFGRNLGLAFQVTDDVLDFTSKGSILGKPALNDIKAGVITCPLLFAAEEHPNLIPIIRRKLSTAGDVETALNCVQSSKGISRSLELADEYVQRALQNLDSLGPSPSKYADAAREALRQLCYKVVTRKY
eukprot:jgi/Ulvmu1/7544/UM037_0088.1